MEFAPSHQLQLLGGFDLPTCTAIDSFTYQGFLFDREAKNQLVD